MDSFTEAAIFLLREQSERETLIGLLFDRPLRKKRAKVFRRRNTEGRFNNLISRHLLDDELKFHGFFRLSRRQFQFLLDGIKEFIGATATNAHKYPITPQEKLAVTLRYLATGESFKSLSSGFRISPSNISRIVKNVLYYICQKFIPILLPPPSESDFRAKAVEFWEKWNFPNCIGAINGKHIRVLCPRNSGSLKCKEYFSVVLLALVDAKYKFLAIDVGCYGKEGDTAVFSNSSMGTKIKCGTLGFPSDSRLPGSDMTLPHVIVADEAFRLRKNLMKPYSRDQAKEDSAKAIFNYRLSRARSVSENAFRLLSQDFRVFCSPLAVKLETCDLLIPAACCLHNLIRDSEGTSLCSSEQHENLQQNPSFIPLSRPGGFGNADGFEVREGFKKFFNGKESEVAKQHGNGK